MNTEDRKYIGDILRAEGNRRINRIEHGDDPDVRDSLVAAAQRCDDLAFQVEKPPIERDVREIGLFAALCAVAREYVDVVGPGTSWLDALHEIVVEGGDST